MTVLLGAQQLRKQRPVVHERLAEVLGACQSLVVGQGEHLGCTVVLHHVGMVDRDVVGLLLEVLDRVPPVAQYLGDQRVSLAGGRGGVVDEPALGGPPRLQVARSGGRLEFDNLELAVPLLALCELGFRGASIARSGDGAGVLGSEAASAAPPSVGAVR